MKNTPNISGFIRHTGSKTSKPKTGGPKNIAQTSYKPNDRDRRVFDSLAEHPSSYCQYEKNVIHHIRTSLTRRPASADRTACRQFQATGQPVSRTRASDAMTSRLPRYEAKCVQRRCFQWGPVPLRSDIKGTEIPPANILIPLERQLSALQLCR